MSNKPTKTKKAMKTMKNFLSMAALALVGAMTVSCSSDDNIIEQPQQPETKNNVVTLTTTVGLGGSNGTRALDASGHKTFAAGETMAVIYNNGTSTVKAVSHALEVSDITDSGKKATFTFDLETPNKSADVTYIYPAAMAKDDGSVNYDALSSQDGTLSTLSSNLDYCTKSGAWDGGNLPTLTLENKLAILAVTLKNEAGTSDITSGTTKLTVSDGTNTYNVNREAAAGPIYVAIRPTTSATIDITATSGGNGYYKTLATKTYAAANGYSVSWRMTPVTLATALLSGSQVTINYNFDNANNSCTYTSNGNGTFTFVSGTGTKELTVENGKIVFRRNYHGSISYEWSNNGFQVTLDPSANTYWTWAGGYYPASTFTSISVNGYNITSQLTKVSVPSIAVNEIARNSDGDSWETIVFKNSGLLYVDDENHVRRTSDNYYLIGNDCEAVDCNAGYDIYDSYSFQENKPDDDWLDE